MLCLTCLLSLYVFIHTNTHTCVETHLIIQYTLSTEGKLVHVTQIDGCIKKTTQTFKCQTFPLSLSNCWAVPQSPGCLWWPRCDVLKCFKTKRVRFSADWAPTQLKYSLLLKCAPSPMRLEGN